MTKYFSSSLCLLILTILLPKVSTALHDPNPGQPDPYFSKLEIENPTPILEADGNSSYTVKITIRDEHNRPIAGIRPTFGSNIEGDFISQPLSTTNDAGITRGQISTVIAYNSIEVPRVLNISNIYSLEYVTTLVRFNPGSARELKFAVQPANTLKGEQNLNTIKVAVQDQYGNISQQNSHGYISLKIANNIGAAKLTGVTSVKIVNGIATFKDLGVSKVGNGYRLMAVKNGLTPTQSNNFNILD